MTTAEAKALIRPMLSDKRYHHSLCVARFGMPYWVLPTWKKNAA